MVCLRFVPFELVDAGDLIILIRKLLSIRGEGTVCISKVKGHADESLVRSGQVRALDRYGNSRAYEAADFCRRWVWLDIADARRNLSGVCRRWYPVVLVLHRFFIAVSRAVVNCDDSSGLAPHPLVWSAGGLPKRRRIADIVRDVALLPRHLHLWDSGWVRVPPVAISAEDVCLWPYTVDILIKFVLFIGPLLIMTWVLVVFPMLIFLFFMSFGLVRGFSLRRLFLVVGGLIAEFQCRLFLLVQALIFGDLVSFLVQCCVRYVLCLVALAGFFLVLLVPTIVGYGTLGGFKSGHGLTSRPRETSDIRFLDELLLLFGYPPRSGVPCCVGLCL